MSLKRLFTLIFILSLVFTFPKSLFAQEAPSISSKNALIVDLNSGATLFEKSSQNKTYIASLTKLMVALLVLEKLDSQEVIEVSSNAAFTSGSTAQLDAGERFYMQDLLAALLIPSGNDASVALAEHLAGSESGFVSLMNQRASELQLLNTYFANVKGFDVGGGYSTPADLFSLTKELLQYDFFKDLIQTKSFNLISLESRERVLTNTNLLLGQTISGLTISGVKTGTTPGAGECLIILAKDSEGAQVLIILLGSEDRYADTTNLLVWLDQNVNLVQPDPALAAWPFPDISSYSPQFFETALVLKTQGLIKGDDGTGFLRGDQPLNRAEMVTFLLRAEGYDTSEELSACAQNVLVQFSDVNFDAWYSDAVYCATSLGWVTGDDLSLDASPNTLTTFRPADSVNLPEAIKLMVESQNNTSLISDEGGHWYDPYFNYLLSHDFIEKNPYSNEYRLSYSDYSLGSFEDFISRMAAFELFYRLQSTHLKAESSYQPSLTLEEYRASGATVELRNGNLFVSDPSLDFELAEVPMGDFNFSQLRFRVQNPSGMNGDYLTRWSIVYPKNLNSKGHELFYVLVYDPDYLSAGFEPDSAGEIIQIDQHVLQFSCDAHLNDLSADHISLYHKICPQVQKSPEISLN